MFGGLRLNERQQALVVLRGAEELEGDSTRAHRTHHGGDFQRRLLSSRRNFEIENVVDPHVRLTLDDAAAHRQVEHGALATDFAAREGKKEPNGNPEMLAAVQRMVRL